VGGKGSLGRGVDGADGRGKIKKSPTGTGIWRCLGWLDGFYTGGGGREQRGPMQVVKTGERPRVLRDFRGGRLRVTDSLECPAYNDFAPGAMHWGGTWCYQGEPGGEEISVQRKLERFKWEGLGGENEWTV